MRRHPRGGGSSILPSYGAENAIPGGSPDVTDKGEIRWALSNASYPTWDLWPTRGVAHPRTSRYFIVNDEGDEVRG